MLFSNVNACWWTRLLQQYGTCVLHCRNFSTVNCLAKDDKLLRTPVSYIQVTEVCNKHAFNLFIYFSPRYGAPTKKRETPALLPCNNNSTSLILFSNQLTNLEMSFTADKCYTVPLNPPLCFERGFLSRHWIAYNRYWTVNLNWKLGSLCLIDFRPQKPNDVLVERNISKDINNYES